MRLSRLLLQAGQAWMNDKAMQMGAALAFYSVLSMAPLLMIAIAIAGYVFGEEAARGEVVSQIRHLVGIDGANVIQTMLKNSRQPGAGVFASSFGIATLLFGASGVFGQLQDSFNVIWKVPPCQTAGVLDFLRQRFLSFAMVLGTGFLLLVSLTVSAVLSAVSVQADALWPGWTGFLQILNLVLSFGTIAGLFALMFRFLPDTPVAWNDVWSGAFLAAILFTCGKSLIGAYLSHAAVGSAYGAAGSLVVLTIWIYYSSQILLFGAEFTHEYAATYGSKAARTRRLPFDDSPA